MPYLPNLRVDNLGASLKILFVNNTDLPRNRQGTFLTEDIVAGATTMRVQSLIGFESLTTSSGQIVLLGKLAEERTEILRTSQTTGLSTTYLEVTLRDSTSFDHAQDTPVFIVDWSRIEFNYAGTATGTKSTLTAYPIAIQADRRETSYREGAKDGVFYFARFNDPIESRNSDWSDAVPSTGYADNTVYEIKRRAVESLGETVDGEIITDEFLNRSLWEARREYHKSPGKRPFRRKFNVDIGNALTGSFRIDLPADVEKPFTAENVYGVRIGAEANMSYYDKKEWDFDYRSKPHSTLELPYTVDASTSIWVANGRDFSASATINVEGTTIGLSRITGEQNSFKIITQGKWNASAGSDVWENIALGLPTKFTVFAEPEGSAYIYFNRPIDTAYVNQNIYADYYRTLVGYNSDADALDEPDYDMYADYLKAKMKHKRNKGQGDITQDPDYKLWIFKKTNALNNEFLSTDLRISPDIEHLSIPL